jgi:hypothetical protein
MGFIELTNMPQAKVLGRFYSTHFSMMRLVWSGILKGWKAWRKTLGLLQLTSHIMSIVRSSPWIDVLISRLGFFAS